MRVLFVTIEGGLKGGANIASCKLMIELKRRGIDVHAAVLEDEVMELLQAAGIPCHVMRRIPFLQWPGIEKYNWKSWVLWPVRLVKFTFWNWKSSRRLVRVIRNIRPDFVESCNGPTLYGYFAARKTGTTHIWHLREYLGKNVDVHVIPSNAYFMKHWLPKSYTIAVSEGVSRFYGCTDPDKNFVVTDGVMHEDEVRYEPDKKPYFLYVGLVARPKGCDELIEAFSLYARKHPENELWIAGRCEPHYQKHLERIAQDMGIDKGRIKFLGFRKDRFELMARAQATIVPSFLEAFGFITVEAMMNGCLVIGRNTGGTKFIMDNSRGGALPFDTTGQMAARMEEVAAKGVESYKDMVLKAQETARRSYTIERCGHDVAAIYEKIKQDESH